MTALALDLERHELGYAPCAHYYAYHVDPLIAELRERRAKDDAVSLALIALEAWRNFSGCCLHSSTHKAPAYIDAHEKSLTARRALDAAKVEFK